MECHIISPQDMHLRVFYPNNIGRRRGDLFCPCTQSKLGILYQSSCMIQSLVYHTVSLKLCTRFPVILNRSSKMVERGILTPRIPPLWICPWEYLIFCSQKQNLFIVRCHRMPSNLIMTRKYCLIRNILNESRMHMGRKMSTCTYYNVQKQNMMSLDTQITSSL